MNANLISDLERAFALIHYLAANADSEPVKYEITTAMDHLLKAIEWDKNRPMPVKQRPFGIDAARLAKAIAAQLFTSGDGKVAERLIFQLPDSSFWGGWSQPAATLHIEKVITALARGTKP